MTKFFEQGRDLSKPLIEIPESGSRVRRLALRLLSGYLWLVFAFFILSMLFYVALFIVFA